MNFMRVFEKTKGAISIFLAIILVAVMMLTGVLVDGARITTGKSQAQSAISTALMSELSVYDKTLKEQYGLFGLYENDPKKLEAIVLDNLNKMLMSKEEKEKLGWKILDLYGYKVERLEITPMYSIAENEVIRDQIVEYMKYRAPKQLAEEFLEKIFSISDLGKQSAIIKLSLNFEKDLTKIHEEKLGLSDNVMCSNTFNYGKGLNKLLNEYIDLLAEKTRLEKQITVFEDKIAEKERELEDAKEEYIKPLEDSISEQKRLLAVLIAAKVVGVETEEIEESPEILETLAEISRLEQEKKDAEKEYIDPLEKEKSKLQEKLEQARTRLGLDNRGRETGTGVIKSAYDNLQNMRDYIDIYITFSNDALKNIKNLEKKAADAQNKAKEIKEKLQAQNSEFAESMRNQIVIKEKEVSTESLDNHRIKIEENKVVIEAIKQIVYDARIDDAKPLQINTAISETVNSYGSDPVVDAEVIAISKEIRKKLSYIETLEQNIDEFKTNIDYHLVRPVEEEDNSLDFRSIIPEFKEKLEESTKKRFEKLTEQFKTRTKEEKEKDKEIWANRPSINKVDSNELYKDILEADEKEIQKKISEMQDFISLASQGLMDYVDESVSNENSMEAQKIMDGMEFKKTEGEGFSDKAFGKVSGIGGMLTSLRDEIYVNEYIVGTFMHINSLRNKEENLSGEEKNDRKSYFTTKAEIEYILAGQDDELANIALVAAEILLIRLVLNTISLITDPTKMNTVNLIAAPAGPFAGAVTILLVFAWAMGESMVDVGLMTLAGKDNIPIMKSRQTWILSPEGVQKSLKELTGEVAKFATTNTIDVVADASTEMAKQVLDRADGKTADFTVDDPEDYKEFVRDEVETIIENKIKMSVDRVFYDWEKSKIEMLDIEETNINKLFEDSLKELENNRITGDESSELLYSIEKTIYEKTPDAYLAYRNGLKTEFEEVENIAKELADRREEYAQDHLKSKKRQKEILNQLLEGSSAIKGLFDFLQDKSDFKSKEIEFFKYERTKVDDINEKIEEIKKGLARQISENVSEDRAKLLNLVEENIGKLAQEDRSTVGEKVGEYIKLLSGETKSATKDKIKELVKGKKKDSKKGEGNKEEDKKEEDNKDKDSNAEKKKKSFLDSKFLTMGYRDYLRFLLLLENKEVKMDRVKDVIQVNMNKEIGTTKYKLSDVNTYMRADADVSIKYLFMTQMFMPKSKLTEEGRYKFNIKSYRGY